MTGHELMQLMLMIPRPFNKSQTWPVIYWVLISAAFELMEADAKAQCEPVEAKSCRCSSPVSVVAGVKFG